MSRKFFEVDLVNTKPGGSCGKPAFGSADNRQSHFGCDSSPRFGLDPTKPSERGAGIKP